MDRLDSELDNTEYIKDIDILGITNMDSFDSFEESVEKDSPSKTNLIDEFLEML